MSEKERKLVMKYSGGMVKHLGLQMYSGVVGAVAELIANAWDADAPRVDVTIPFDSQWNGDPSVKISVRDYGLGMKFDEVNNDFLYVGRDRRKSTGTDLTEAGRKVMGRKGIGKLACFGIARRVEVRTVKDNWATHFEMDYDKIVGAEPNVFVRTQEYEPTVLEDKETVEPSGTEVILKYIQIHRRQTEDQFRQSMARRFSILSDRFEIYINGQSLRRDEMPFQFRFPDQSWNEEEVAGLGMIRWWAGFSKDPIKDDEARGFVVMARGKMAQAPFFFNLSGGAGGQLGMQYMTGEVEADLLDDADDLIATDRASIRWESPRAVALETWGKQKVRQLLNDWRDGRVNLRTDPDKLRQRIGENNWSRLNSFQSTEKNEIMRAVRTFAGIETIDDDRFKEIVELLLRAYDDQNFMNMLRTLNKLDVEDQNQVLEFIAEVNILEAVKTASIIRARVEVVRKLRQLINQRAPEKLSTAPLDMHTILKENPWLIDPSWDTLRHEQQFDTLLKEHFGLPKRKKNDEEKSEMDTKRFDFFCLRDSQHAVIVEVKRPGEPAGKDQIVQIMDYVDHLNNVLKKQDATRTVVSGYLIVHKVKESDITWRERAIQSNIHVVTWEQVWRRSEQLYGEFLDLRLSKAPTSDPRIQSIVSLEDDS